MKALLILLIATVAGTVSAESKTEAELRLKMASIQRALDDAKRERDTFAASLARERAAATARTAKTTKALDVVTQEQAGVRSDLADKAAIDVKTASEAAQSAERAASQLRAQNSSLFIVQLFALTALLVGVSERLWKGRKDTQRLERDHQWQLDAEIREKAMDETLTKVHKLVNSQYTAALESELDARTANLVLLRANLVLIAASSAESHSGEITAITATIASTSIKISELTRTLAERAAQAK